MKNKVKWIFYLAILFSLVWTQVAYAQGPTGDKFVLGDSFTLKSGEELGGNLFVLSGVVTLEENSRVNGDVFVASGSLRVDGTIGGDLFAASGNVDLGSTARVNGNVNVMAAHLNRAEGAQVGGDVYQGTGGPFIFTPPVGIKTPALGVRLQPLWDVLWFILRCFLWAALAVLVVLFLPRPSERIAHAVVAQPFASGGLGCLTVLVAPILLIAIAITIIGIPLSLLGALLLAASWAYGLIALGTEVGRRFAHAAHLEWALPVSAGLGTFALIFVINGINALVPCIGWLVPALVGMIALGAVLLTRYGSSDYPPAEPVPANHPWADRPPSPTSSVDPLAESRSESSVDFRQPPTGLEIISSPVTTEPPVEGSDMPPTVDQSPEPISVSDIVYTPGLAEPISEDQPPAPESDLRSATETGPTENTVPPDTDN